MTETRTVFVAPGQGSQRPDLFQLAKRFPEVHETYEAADEIALELFGPSRVGGKSISEWAKNGTQDELATNTVITQPLIIATSGKMEALLNVPHDFLNKIKFGEK